MKLLLINYWFHNKNLNALLNYKNINVHVTQETNLDLFNLSDFDVIYSPSFPLDVKKYPNSKFIFGPHFSVFPEKHQIELIEGNNSVYTQPSEWVIKFWKKFPLCKNIKIKELPFGVDTEKFIDTKPISEREKVFIYYKSRHPEELEFVEKFLKSKNINYLVFSYESKYNENNYLDYLKNSKYGIWLGRHESQGFALEEALSCNVPLIVWDVKSMNQEYRCNYDDIPGTAIPYWHERCGEFFYNKEELEYTYEKFISKINYYKPREYILNNLSMEKCENRLIEIIKNF